ncbi:unnamed protein product [Discula destructiva]
MAFPLARALTVVMSITLVAAGSPSGYQGCFREGTWGRALVQKTYSSPSLTTAACASYCAGFRYYGTEYGNECFCGTKLDHGAYQVPDSACNTPCAGAQSETCGGGNLLSLYKTSFTDQIPQLNYTYKGCVGEPDSERALDRVIQVKQMTRNKCLVICAFGNFVYAGLEYGNECWCGNKLGNVKPQGTCNLPCAGNSSETCGGSFSLDLFVPTKSS